MKKYLKASSSSSSSSQRVHCKKCISYSVFVSCFQSKY